MPFDAEGPAFGAGDFGGQAGGAPQLGPVRDLAQPGGGEQGIGGVIAEQWGLAAPFWFAFVGSGITLALVWSRLSSIAHAEEPEPVEAS